MNQTNADAGPRSTRVPELDGLRGAFLILMTLAHLRLASDFLQKLHPSEIIYPDAAYGFVFLSGVVAGLVYGRVALKHGFAKVQRRTLKRALSLYACSAGLILSLTAVALAWPRAGEAWSSLLGPMAHPHAGTWIAALLLLQEIEFGDILPQYVLYLVLAPVPILAALSGHLKWVLGASVLTWLVVQFGAAAPIVGLLNAFLHELGPDLHVTGIFNVAAWQLLFVVGCGLAVEVVRRPETDWRVRARLDDPRLLRLVLVVLILLSLLRLAEHAGGFGLRLESALQPLTSKSRIGVLTLVDLIGIVWLTAWLLLVAAPSAHPVWGRCGRLFQAVLLAPALRLLGRHSLLVYLWHVVLVYAVQVILPYPDQVPEPLRSLDVLFILALLFVPPLVKDWLQRFVDRSCTPAGASN